MNYANLIDYAMALAWHDWHYQYSDDSRVYRSYHAVQQSLRDAANYSPDHKALYAFMSKKQGV